MHKVLYKVDNLHRTKNLISLIFLILLRSHLKAINLTAFKTKVMSIISSTEEMGFFFCAWFDISCRVVMFLNIMAFHGISRNNHGTEWARLIYVCGLVVLGIKSPPSTVRQIVFTVR